MPIDYAEYHPKWSLISYLIRFVRARNRCEKCGVANHSTILKTDRSAPGPQQWGMFNDLLRRDYSKAQARKLMGFTLIVLTVAHLDHNKKNNRFWNLAALCQRCHLKHDIKQHAENRKYGRNWKRAQHAMEFPEEI